MSDNVIIQRSLVDQIYGLLLKKIQNGELKPGDRLKIENLSKEFGVSRTPIREAISRLQQNGFVVTKHNVGPSVATFDREQFLAVIKANAIILNDIADLIFTEENYDDLIAVLDKIVKEQETALDNGDTFKFFELSISFHEALINASPNNVLADFAMSLQVQLDSYVAAYQRDDDMRITSLKDHSLLVDKLREGDAESFKKAFLNHNMEPVNYFRTINE